MIAAPLELGQFRELLSAREPITPDLFPDWDIEPDPMLAGGERAVDETGQQAECGDVRAPAVSVTDADARWPKDQLLGV